MTQFVRLTLSFVVGMVLANFFVYELNTYYLALLCGTNLAILLLLHLRKKKGASAWFGVAAMTFFVLAGMTLFTRKHHSIAQGIPTYSTLCMGTLQEMPVEKARSYALKVKQSNGIHIIIYIGKGNEQDELTGHLRPGDTIIAHTTHIIPTEKAEGEFAYYQRYLFNNGICATAYAPNNQWKRIPKQGEASLSEQLSILREKLHGIYVSRGFDGYNGEVIEAMTLGRKQNLSKSTKERYAASGVSHILALSGYHIGIILSILQVLLLWKFVPYSRKWIVNLIAIAILWLYALIAGLSPSLTRATLMCSILLICQSFTLQYFSLNSIAIALFIMLSINPLALFDVGLQLSFVSVIGISIFGKNTSRVFRTRNKLLSFLLQTIAISAVCSVVTAPLVAFYFGKVPLLSIASNLIVTLFVLIILWSSALWWLTLSIPFVNDGIGSIMNTSAAIMNYIVEHIASVPFATCNWHPSYAGVIACYALLFIANHIITLTKPRKKQRR